MDILEAEARSGKTVVATTHDLACAAQRFQQVATVNRTIIAHGPSSLILDPDVLARTYGGHLLVLGGQTVVLDDAHHHDDAPGKERHFHEGGGSGRRVAPRASGALMDLLTEPLTHAFFVRALIAASLVGIVCAVVGTFVVLKGLAFIGDAISHAAFPGVVAAYIAPRPDPRRGRDRGGRDRARDRVRDAPRRGPRRHRDRRAVRRGVRPWRVHVQHDPGLRRRPVRVPVRVAAADRRRGPRGAGDPRHARARRRRPALEGAPLRDVRPAGRGRVRPPRRAARVPVPGARRADDRGQPPGRRDHPRRRDARDARGDRPAADGPLRDAGAARGGDRDRVVAAGAVRLATGSTSRPGRRSCSSRPDCSSRRSRWVRGRGC